MEIFGSGKASNTMPVHFTWDARQFSIPQTAVYELFLKNLMLQQLLKLDLLRHLWLCILKLKSLRVEKRAQNPEKYFILWCEQSNCVSHPTTGGNVLQCGRGLWFYTSIWHSSTGLPGLLPAPLQVCWAPGTRITSSNWYASAKAVPFCRTQ